MTENADGKQRHGFRKGQSGNPRGKPPGTRNVALRALDALGTEAAQGLLQSVIAKAMSGDTVAARIILDRVWPVRKSRPIILDLPPITTAADTVRAMAGILAATASGQLTPDEASALTGIIEAQRKAIELGEIERRLSELEARHDSENPT